MWKKGDQIMQIKLSETIPLMMRLINDDGREIQWPVNRLFNNEMFFKKPWLFTHINQFWNGHNGWRGVQKETKNKIFEIYLQIWDILENIYDGNIASRDHKLAKLIGELYEEHKLSKIKMYMIFSDIKMPAGLKSVYEHNQEQIDKNHTRVKTYLLEDYKELAALSLQLRLMLPIWAVYLNQIKKSIGTYFKEIQAFELLKYSCIMEEPPLQKLTAYINSCIPKNTEDLLDVTTKFIMECISSDEYSRYITNDYIVKKLSISDIRGINTEDYSKPCEPILLQHLATSITQGINAEKKNTDEKIRPKIDKNQKNAEDEENQTSIFENYKIKEDISRGDIQYLLHCISDPYRIAKIIEPTTQNSLIDSTLRFAPKIAESEPGNPQTILLSWMINSIIPGEAVEYMDRMVRANCLCACSAAYWTKGHHVIAALCTATPINSDKVYNSSASGGMSKINSETLKELGELFPYSRMKKGIPKKELQDSIDMLITILSDKAWEFNLTDEQMQILSPDTVSKHFILPRNIKELVARLVIEICRQQKERVQSALSY